VGLAVLRPTAAAASTVSTPTTAPGWQQFRAEQGW